MKKTQENNTSTQELIRNLKSADENLKLQSISQQPQIANLLGPKRITNELLPYLQDLLNDDENILIKLCQALSYIKLPPNDRPAFIAQTKYFEEMSAYEEPILRQEAITSIIRYQSTLPKEIASKNSIIIMNNLLVSNNILKREAAVSLLASISEFLNETDYKYIIDWTKEFIDDDERYPNIAVIAAKALPSIIKNAPGGGKYDKRLYDLCKFILDEKKDILKQYISDLFQPMRNLNKGQAEDQLKNVLDKKDWRLKFSIFSKILKITEIFGKGLQRQYMKKYLSESLVDSFIEVKIFSQNTLKECCEIMDVEDINNSIIPCQNTLTGDNEVVVRTRQASNICSICPIIGKKNTSEYLLSIILNLLRDESIEVKTALQENLEGLAQATNVVSLGQAFHPVIYDMSTSKCWRLKDVSQKFILFLAEKGGADVFNSDQQDVKKFIGQYLLDDFFSVRNCAIAAVKKICEKFGETWFGNNMMPLIDRMELSRNFKVRVSYIHLSKELLKVTSGPVLKIQVQRVQSLCNDPVPNVKINASQALVNITKVYRDKTYMELVISSQIKQKTDSDEGVVFAADDSLAKVKGGQGIQVQKTTQRNNLVLIIFD